MLLGAAISIFLLLLQASRPRVTELGRVAGTASFADLAGHAEHQRTDGVLIVRIESSLLYFNVDYVRDRIALLLAARQDAVKLIVAYLGSVPRVDLAGAEFIAELQRTFAARGIAIQLAEPHGEVRSALRRIGFEPARGTLESGQTVDVVLTAWQTGAESHDAAVARTGD